MMYPSFRKGQSRAASLGVLVQLQRLWRMLTAAHRSKIRTCSVLFAIASSITVMALLFQAQSYALTSADLLSFKPVVTYSSGGRISTSVVVADLNGDGKPDLLVANEGGNLGLLLGNGDGTFQPAIPLGAVAAYFLAVGDLNGDGKLDVVTADLGDDTVKVLLGYGNGVFRPAVTYSSGGHGPTSVAIADVNGDHRPDLIVTNATNLINVNLSGVVSLLLGNGDGTFQPAVNYDPGGLNTWSVAVVDLNGDGRRDLVLANACAKETCGAGFVSVLLGDGDGTFQSPVNYSSGGKQAWALTVADLNGDGKTDVAVVNAGPTNVDCNVGVLLGNGDGTLQPAVTYRPGGIQGNGSQSLAVADVNGDGKLDIVTANCDRASGEYCATNPGPLGVLLGNGDGTFQAPVTFATGGPAAWAVALADLNNDFAPDLIVVNYCADTNCKTGSVGILLNDNPPVRIATNTAIVSSLNPSLVGQAVTFTATVSASSGAPPNSENVIFYNGSAMLAKAPMYAGKASLTTTLLSEGSFTISAKYAGDATFLPSTSTVQQTVNPGTKFATATAFSSSLNPSIYGQKVTFTARVIGLGPVPPTGTVVFMWKYFTTTYTIGSANLNSAGVATLTKSNLNAYPYPMIAVYRGDSNNLGSTSAVLNQTVLQTTSAAALTSSVNPSTAGQAITFTAKFTSPTVIPSGPVTFKAGTTLLGTAQLSSGKAIFTTSTLPAGSTAVKVIYNGNSNIKGSSASVIQAVQP